MAPFVVKMGTSRSGTGTITITRNVSYHDLDLTKDGDVTTLKQRIDDAARTLCRQLDKHYSTPQWSNLPADRNCRRNATATAMAEADMVIAGARGKS